MSIYIASVGAADGQRSYEIITPDPQEALDFLKRYDHEGSCVEVDVVPEGCPVGSAQTQTHPDEHAYHVLEADTARVFADRWLSQPAPVDADEN